MLKLKKIGGIKKHLGRTKALTAVVMIAIVAVGSLLGLKKAGAFEGDDWTTTYDGLSITVVSVEQNGASLTPQNDGEGGYYFDVANNTDAVRVGVRVEGMVQDETYYYHPTSQWWLDDRIDLTYEDNGIVIYQDLNPEISFGDDYYLSGKYHVGASVSREHGSGVRKNIVVRPTSIGSHSIDIISVKQGGTDLAIENNEYQITDYSTPVTLTYKFKNLEVGKNYSAGVGYNDWYQFKAENTQTAETTRELALDLVNSHIETNVYLQGSGVDERVELYFTVADDSFKSLGNIVVDEIEQGGAPLTAEMTTSGGQREYTFEANDAQGLTVMMHATETNADMNYYVFFNMNGLGDGYSSDEPLMVTGEELEMGTVLTIPAAFGMIDASPFTLSFTINTTGFEVYGGYSSQKVFYQPGEGDPLTNSDALKFVFQEEDGIPRYDARMLYSDGTVIDSDRISPALHDDEHSLLLEVRGEHYNDATTYDVEAKVKVNGESEPYYSHVFRVTGAELNEGTVLTLSDLTLELPEFDPTGATSGYELYYVFSLSIDGLKQSGEMLYVYEGWINPSITYNNGDVIAMGSGGGIGGDFYTTLNGATVRKSSFNESRGAKINYFAGAFDDTLSYNYAIYYNDNVGEDWWSEPAGTIVSSDTVTGEALNNNGLTVNIATPSNESEGVMYTLVITRGGRIVKMARDYIVFTDEPKIESFKFTTDSDSFMQIERSAYRVATGTDITATLTGDGFEDKTEYRLWVSYEGYRFEEDEYYPHDVDLTDLNNSVVVTGAQLNAGYVYALNYVEAFDNVNYIDVGFAVSDRDADEPSWYGETGNGSYSGHAIHIDYVNDDEVFRDNGYQVNEDGTITDVSQPDDPHHGPDEPEEVPVDIRTPGEVDVIVDGTGLTIVSRKPTLVIGLKNGHYSLLEETQSIDNDGERTNSYDMSGYEEIKVVLKGDGDMNGTIDPGDLNRLNRSLISPTLGSRYRPLTDLEKVIFDFDKSGDVTPVDLNTLNRALISPTLVPRYREIQW